MVLSKASESTYHSSALRSFGEIRESDKFIEFCQKGEVSEFQQRIDAGQNLDVAHTVRSCVHFLFYSLSNIA